MFYFVVLLTVLSAPASTDTSASSAEETPGPTAANLHQLASSLVQWRALLPRDLQWVEEDPTSFPNPNTGPYSRQLDPNLSPQQAHSGISLFSADLNSEPVHYPYLYDIQVALLRTRYYCAKFMVYRPFCYKALHYPEQMMQEDAQGVAECLACLLKLLKGLS